MNEKFTAEEVLSAMDEAVYALGFLPGGDGVLAKKRLQKARSAYADTMSKPADSGLVGDARQELLDELELVILAHVGMQAGDEGAPAMTIRVCRAAIAALAAQGQGEAVAKVRHFDYRGIARNGFSQEAQMLDGAPVLPDGTLLYTRLAPPASPAGVPDGMALVPRTPTTEMVAAGHDTYLGAPNMACFGLVWKAMLAAAPSAPEGDGGAE